MKKTILLFGVLLYCGQMAAQDVRADSVTISQQVENTAEQMQMLDLWVRTIEDEYDLICDYVLPHSFIAVRNNERLLVDALTGKETVLESHDEDYPDFGD